MPVVLAGLEDDAITGTDHLDGTAATLAEPDPLGDVDRLTERMRVSGGACARRGVDEVGLCSIGGGRSGEGVDIDIAGKPVVWALGRVDATCDMNEEPLVAEVCLVQEPQLFWFRGRSDGRGRCRAFPWIRPRPSGGQIARSIDCALLTVL